MGEFKEYTKLSESTIIVACDHQTSAQLGDEKVILDLEKGKYYGLNPVGVRIWEIIQTPTSIRNIVSTITSDYNIRRSRCLEKISPFLENLRKNDLISTEEK